MTASPAEPRPQAARRVISAGEEGQRLDNYLARLFRSVPRSRLYSMLRRGEVRVNGSRARPSRRLLAGDELRLPPVRVAQAAPAVRPGAGLLRDLEERILHEDQSLLVVNKPAGLAAHGGSGLECGLIEALRALRPELECMELCHRLDRDTSGCLIVAKGRAALRSLHEQFRQRRIGKRYLALVAGSWERRVRSLEAPLRRLRLPSGELRVEVSFRSGEPSATAFEIVQAFGPATLLAAMPRTGRTHQIRVHCAYARHPVGNDDKYGDERFNAELRRLGLRRMFLHAQRIAFEDPRSGRRLKIEAPLDQELQRILSHYQAAS